MGDALRSLGKDDAPPEAWEERVRQRIRDSSPGPGRLPRWWPALPVAAGVVAVLFLARQPPPAEDLQLAVRVEPDRTQARRGEAARPGDHLAVEAHLPAARHALVRVYRNDGRAVCETRAQHEAPRPTALQLTCLLESAGRYQVLLLAADQPLPATLGSPDQDAGAALAAGGQAKLAPDVHVQ